MRHPVSRGEVGRVDSHVEEYERGGELCEGEVIAGRLIVAGGDAAIVLESVDEAFGQIACFVGLPIVFARREPVAARRDDDFGAVAFHDRDEEVRIVAFIGDELCEADGRRAVLRPA